MRGPSMFLRTLGELREGSLSMEAFVNSRATCCSAEELHC